MKIWLAYLLLMGAFLGVDGQTPSGLATGDLRLVIKNSKADSGQLNLLIRLAKLYVPEIGQYANHLDSVYITAQKALKMSEKLNQPKWKAACLALMADYYIIKKDQKSADLCIKEATVFFHLSHDNYQEALAWYDYGRAVCFYGSKNEQEFYSRALLLFEKSKRKKEAANVKRDIAYSHFRKGEVHQAENELLSLLAEYKTLGYYNEHYTYMMLSEINKVTGDLNKQLFYALEGVKAMEASGDTTRAGDFYMDVAIVYTNLGLFINSLEWADKSILVYKRREQTDIYYNELNLIIFDLIHDKKPREALNFLKRNIKEMPPENKDQEREMYEGFGNCYTALSDYKNAEIMYKKMLSLFDEYPAANDSSKDYSKYNDLAHYYKAIANLYVVSKQYKKADYYIGAILHLPKNTVIPTTLSKFYLMQFQVDSALRRYIPAIKSYERHKILNDSIFDIQKSKQIADLQLKYDISQKEQTIKILNSQAMVQHGDLQRANLERNITISGVALLLILTGFAYRGYRNKQRSNIQLQGKQDVINEKNITLLKLLTEKDALLLEKDWLLKEVHHRVKNNLQIVMSLLSTQSAYLENDAALEAISASRNRLQAISLIHQKLYSVSNVASIDMRTYIADLVNYLRDCLDTIDHRIRFEQLVEPVRIDLSQAVPIGLILNEAITNAIKYAFDKSGGTIIIALQSVGNDNLLLTVTDDGKGLPDEFDVNQISSFGIELMKALCRQLKGTFEMRNKPGVTVMIDFQVEKILDNPQHEGYFL